MREIKFRAWDKKRSVMITEAIVTPFYISDFDRIRLNPNDAIPMQYTGLKDKNGKEIYEGDILHVLEVSNTSDKEYKSPVEFIDSGFLVTQPDDCQVPLAVFHNLENSYPLFEIEVIGNIYEHPRDERSY